MRHAAEFWMIEPEIAFADLSDDMKLAEDMLKYVIAYILEHCPDDLAFFNNFVDKGLLSRLEQVVSADFAHITYTQAVELLQKSNVNFEYPVSWGCDLQSEHERYLAEQVFKRPVFVTDYPREIKAFYMRLNEDGKTVAAMDLHYSWYADLRKYGGCKHAGFGLGFERLIMYVTGMSNIRDVIPYPRTVGSVEF